MGEDEGRFICLPASSALKIFERSIGVKGDELKLILNELVQTGTVRIQRFGRGSRICVQKDDELQKIKEFILLPEESKVSFEEFEKLFDDTIIKLSSGSVTGFVDLGKVRDYMMKMYGISEDLFITYVQKLLMSKRWKYAMCHGGSLRLKIGNAHVGLVKLVRR